MSEVLNVVVCYKNPEEIIEYAGRLAKLNSAEKIALSVVINDDTTNPEKLRSSLNKICSVALVTKPHANLGYLRGMMEAIRAYEEKFKEIPQWIIMSNTDISYADSDFIDIFLSTSYPESVWCIGPSVYVPSKNAYDNPVLRDRRSHLTVEKLIIVFSIPGLRTIYQMLSNVKTKICKRGESEKGFVYQVHGCYFIIHSDLYDAMSKRPFEAFMYSEEAYIAEMIYINGKKEFFDSNLRVNHHEHSVTSKLKYKEIAQLSRDSMKYIKKEFYQ